MTLADVRSARSPEQDTPPQSTSRLVRWCDAGLDAAIVGLATWTVVYHLCLVLRLGVSWAVGLETTALVGCVIWVVVQRRQGLAQTFGAHQDDRTPTAATTSISAAGSGDQAEPHATTQGAGRNVSRWVERTLVIAASVCTGVAALAMALDEWWPLVAGAWLAASVLGTTWAAVRLWGPANASTRREPRPPAVSGAAERRSAVIALAWGVAMGVFTLCVLRPNRDDVYYVNLSQWVTDHGTFPLRDTIFSNLRFPMSSWPPTASYDALSGTVARLADVRAAFVVYIVAPPVAAFLSVLALWRLLRAWEVKAVATALSSALVFLLLDGAGKDAPGNLFGTLLFQAKYVLLGLMVPVLLVYALRFVERPTRERAGWLFVGGVASVGVTTSAMFVTPLIAVAGAAPLLRRAPRRALLGFAAMAAYPVASGVVTKAVGGHSADSFHRRLYRFDPQWFGHAVFGDRGIAVLAVTAVLLGVLLVPNPRARVTTGVLSLFVGITYIPGFTHLSFDAVGLGPTLWRVSFVASVGALVGVLATRLGQRSTASALQAVGPIGLIVMLVAFGQPIGTAWTTFLAPFHYQRPPETVAMANRVIERARPGDVVLAPVPLSISISVLTTRVHSVAARGYVMDTLGKAPGFHLRRRLALSEFVTENAPWRSGSIQRDLRVVGVDTVCMGSRKAARLRAVRALGFSQADRTVAYTCLTR
jgi:hypothetical protein